jgi:hypothetical protein
MVGYATCELFMRHHPISNVLCGQSANLAYYFEFIDGFDSVIEVM